MRRPRETFAFLCAVLSFAGIESRREPLRRSIAEGRISWPWLVRQASEHEVAAGLSRALERSGLADDLPAELRGYFEAVATLNGDRNRRILQEALALATTLSQLGVVPVFLKGTADLITGLRPDPGERMQQDIDVLVPAEALADCVSSLRQNGYESLIGRDRPLAHHAAPLWRAGGAATIELHSDALAYPYAHLLPAGDVLKTAATIGWNGITVGVPSPLDRIVHLVAHAQLVDLGLAYGRIELRHLLDMGYLAERYRADFDWQAVFRRFDRHVAALEVLLHLARRLVAAPIPEIRAHSPAVAMQCRRALWQAGAPGVTSAAVRLLRPPLLLKRSLSNGALRHRLAGNLIDMQWLKRQVRHIVG